METLPIKKNNYFFILIISFLVLLTIGTIIYFRFFSTQKQEFKLTSQNKVSENLTEQTGTVGVGWSTKENPQEAVSEAIEKAKRQLGLNKPKFAYITFTVGYRYNQILEEIKKQLDPQIKIHGLTSSGGVMTNEGLHIGNIGSIAIMLIASDNVDFGVASIDLTNVKSAHDAGKNAILQAIKDAGYNKETLPKMVLYAGTPRRGDDLDILEGIADVIGPNVPVIGGNAGDEVVSGNWKKFSYLTGADWVQFTNNKSFHNGLVLTAIFTDSKVGWSFDSGAKITNKGGVVTKSKGNIIYEIDKRPALDVYSEWLEDDGKLMELLKTNNFKDIVTYTAHSPLSKVLRLEDGQIGYYTLHPIPQFSDIATKTLPMAVPVIQGMEVRLFSGTWQTTLNRAETIPSDALIRGNIKVEDGLFGIVTFCEGAAVSMPESEAFKIPVLTNNVIRGMPFIGAITEGEHGPLLGVRNINANLAESMLIIGKN